MKRLLFFCIVWAIILFCMGTSINTGGGSGSGDVTGSGDCTSGACLDGTSDGGTYIRIYDGDSNYMQLDVENCAADYILSLPTTVGTAGQILQSDGDNTTSWTAAGAGDVLKVGDCESGECYDGSSDGGTYVRIYDGDSNYSAIVSSNVSSDVTITLPSSTSTLLATDGAGTNLTALNGENIQNDTIDDDSIDFVDVTLADLTFDVGSVDTTEYGYLNGVTDAIQTQIDATVLSAGNCTSGACYDGSSDGGTYIGLYDGNSNYTEIVSGDVSATTTITLPTSTCTLLATDGVGTNLTALNGENIQNDTIDDDSIDFTDVTLSDITFDVGSVSTTEYGYLDGVTDAIQTQIDAIGNTAWDDIGDSDANSEVDLSTYTNEIKLGTNGTLQIGDGGSNYVKFLNDATGNVIMSLEGNATFNTGVFTISDEATLARTGTASGDWFSAASAYDEDGANYVPLVIPVNANDPYVQIGSADNNIQVTADGTCTFNGDFALPANSVDSDQYVDGSIDEPHMNFSNSGTDGHIVTYNSGGTNFTWTAFPVEIGVALSDESTDLTAGTNTVTMRAPYAFTLTDVRANVNTAGVGTVITVDINESATTILSTKLEIDSGEKTSESAANSVVISDSSIADDAELTFDIDQIGDSTAGKGLKIWLIGTRTL